VVQWLLLERPDDRLTQVRCGVHRFVNVHRRTRGALHRVTELELRWPADERTTVVVAHPASAVAGGTIASVAQNAIAASTQMTAVLPNEFMKRMGISLQER
jgi:hypothetical protein